MQLLTLAADNQIDMSSVLPALSTVGSLGFAVWYAYYTTTFSLPKMAESHRQERTEMQVRFDSLLREKMTEREALINRFDNDLRLLQAEMKSQREALIAKNKANRVVKHDDDGSDG